MGKSSRAGRLAKEVRIDEKPPERLKRPDYRGFLEKKVIHVLLITIIALCAYSNTFHNPFLFDDEPSIVDNQFIKSLDNFLLNTKGYNYSPPAFWATSPLP